MGISKLVDSLEEMIERKIDNKLEQLKENLHTGGYIDHGKIKKSIGFNLKNRDKNIDKDKLDYLIDYLDSLSCCEDAGSERIEKVCDEIEKELGVTEFDPGEMKAVVNCNIDTENIIDMLNKKLEEKNSCQGY